jgi:hypothetical protein
MTRLKQSSILAGVLFMLCQSAALALPTRTFVSGHGADSGACTLVAPCRSFAFAIGQTAAGGEIDVLDPAGYGALTIAKSISIVNDGVGTAGVQAGSGATAITVNAGPTDVVQLRGLTVEGAKVGANGAVFSSGGSLTIVNCVVRNFSNIGVAIIPSAATLNYSTFSISDTIVADNGFTGISVNPQSGGTASGVLDHVAVINNSNGIVVDGSSTAGTLINVAVLNSTMANNAGPGVYSSTSSSGSGASVMVRNSTSNHNTYGFETTQFLGQTVANGNNYGVQLTGSSSVYTFGDNIIDGNVVQDVSGMLASIPPV